MGSGAAPRVPVKVCRLAVVEAPPVLLLVEGHWVLLPLLVVSSLLALSLLALSFPPVLLFPPFAGAGVVTCPVLLWAVNVVKPWAVRRPA